MILYRRDLPRRSHSLPVTSVYVIIDGGNRSPEYSSLLKVLSMPDGMFVDYNYVTKFADDLIKLATIQSPLEQIKANYPELLL